MIDLNVGLATNPGGRYVLKIANAAEDRFMLAAQKARWRAWRIA